MGSTFAARRAGTKDRKSTRLNSSHSQISYAVFCLKKKKEQNWQDIMWEVSKRMDPEREVTLVDNTPINYIDFASPHSGLSSNIGLYSSFFFTAAATPEIYTLSLHDALPI